MTLTKEEIERFKQRLEAMKRQLNQTLGQVAQEVTSSEETKGHSQHQADEGTDDFGQTINIELTAKEQKTLSQIERALEKIKEETYGLCDLSGDEIPIARLEAIPYATMTVQAQEKYEKGLL